MNVIILVICCLIFGFPVYAETALKANLPIQIDDAGDDVFALIDLDNNGFLSEQEVSKIMSEQLNNEQLQENDIKKAIVDFRKADINKDGELDKVEAEEFIQKMLGHTIEAQMENMTAPQLKEILFGSDKYQEFDTSLVENHQKIIEAESQTDEWQDQSADAEAKLIDAAKIQAREAFAKADLNKDDYLSFDEFKKYTVSSMSEMMESNIDTSMLEDNFFTERFEEVDAYKDGKLSQQEFLEDYLNYIEAN